MKVSTQWLSSWVAHGLSEQALVDELTMAGLEVDALTELGASLEDVVVAEITSLAAHPDADKLRVCQVNDGEQTLQIVCGAPNARAGIKVPLAKVGAVLPGELKIKAAKLRGVESNGMLCAQKELGLGDDDDGLWELPAKAEVGASLREQLGLPDSVIELDITPNRGDCFSMAGVAREVAVIARKGLCAPECAPVAASIDDTFPVRVEAEQDCPRYLGRVLRGVDVSASSPAWLQQRIERAGMRSIDPVVDVTNYVMLELGQPLHAFDLDGLDRSIVVRKARAEESMVLLDGNEIRLDDTCLLIADESKALALAGIMGGQDSGIQSGTNNLMLESAFFSPVQMAGRARRFGLHTESSLRYERGVDPELARSAMERATQLLLDIVGGQAGPITEASAAAAIPGEREIELRARSIKRLLGFEMSSEEVEDILQRLGFAVSAMEEGWRVRVPPRRFDITLEADLLEELARIYGYNRLPTAVLKGAQLQAALPEAQRSCLEIKQCLLERDYQEAITYSFIDPALHREFFAEQPHVVLQNPIASDMSVMRTSLLPGLLRAVAHNHNRQKNRVRLFEHGQCFLPSTGHTDLAQESWLAGAAFGPLTAEGWAREQRAVDFYDVKGDVETLLGTTSCRFEAATHAAMHPGQCAKILQSGTGSDTVIGHVGMLHPRLQTFFELPAGVAVFEVRTDKILDNILPSFEKISKFPEVRRDIAIIVDKQVPVADIHTQVQASAKELLVDFVIFDVYDGDGVPEGRKSVGLGLTFQHHSRTLVDEDINACLDQTIKNLKDNFGATLRS